MALVVWVVAFWALPDSDAVQRIWLTGLLVAPIVLIAAARTALAPPNPGWARLRAAMMVQGVGMFLGTFEINPLEDYATVVTSAIAFPALLSAFRSLGAPASGRDRTLLLDSLIVGLAVATVWWSLILGPQSFLAGGTAATAENLVSLVLIVLLISVVLRYAFGDRGRPRYSALLAGAALSAIMFTLAHWTVSPGESLHASHVAPLLGLAYALVGIAAIHPSVALPVLAPPAPTAMYPRLLVVSAALLVPLVIRMVCLSGAGADCGASLLVFETLLFVAVGTRLVGAILGRHRTQLSLDDHHRLYWALAEHAGDGVAVVDDAGVVRFATPAVTGMAGTGVVGQTVDSLVAEEHVDALSRAFADAGAAPGTVATATVRPARRPETWIEARVIDHRGDPAIDGYIVNARDITRTVNDSAELTRLAYEDVLTGLANRAALLHRVEARLVAGERLAVLFCDFDRLKVVNDTLGHAAGDQLLAAAAGRMRRLAGPNDVIGRLGGDEFLVVTGGATRTSALATAERLRQALSEPYGLSGATSRISCSIGVALSRTDSTADQLIADADAALYAAKALGRDKVVVFDHALRVEQARRTRTQLELPGAIDGEQLTVHYQPIVTVDTARVWGAEALVRWNHPVAGLLPPSAFIDVAEESGLIRALGATVTAAAVRMAAQLPELPVLTVNVAGAQLEDDDFSQLLARLLADHAVDPRRILLEVTERSLLRDGLGVVGRLEELRTLGVRVALDDFGTGYASFATMRSLPLDVLKVDQTLVAADSGRGSVLRAVVTMAHELDLEVIVEGIERPEQLRVATDLGADLVQGFLLGRPGDAHRLEDVVGRSGLRWAADSAYSLKE